MSETFSSHKNPSVAKRARRAGFRAERIKRKREEAAARQKEYLSRTPQQQLDLLDSRLGKGNGAKKEREKLLKLMPK